MTRVTSFALSASLLLVAALLRADDLLSGIEAFNRGSYMEAEAFLRHADSVGKDPRAAVYLALTTAATNRCEDAEPALRAAFDKAAHPLTRLAGLALAQCYLSANNYESAVPVVFKLKAAFPDDADVLYQAARLYMRGWNDALYQLYRRNPSSFRVNQISAEILETQGHFTEAVAEYRKAIDKNPSALNLHFRLGRALLMSSHEPAVLDQALLEFLAETERNPLDAIAQYQIAQVYVAQNKPELASDKLRSALKLRPSFPEALIALGKLLSQRKSHEEAILLLQRAVKLAPRSEGAHYGLMLAYRDAGKTAEAKAEKLELEKLQKVPEGEFSDFLKKLGEKAPAP